jgi:hypothetical protein
MWALAYKLNLIVVQFARMGGRQLLEISQWKPAFMPMRFVLDKSGQDPMKSALSGVYGSTGRLISGVRHKRCKGAPKGICTFRAPFYQAAPRAV